MNRANFIKSSLAAIAGIFVGNRVAHAANFNPNKKIGFVHLALNNILPGDIQVIDNKTGKFIKFDGEDQMCNGRPIGYGLVYADDTTGLVGGYKRYWRHEIRDYLYRPFHEIRDISIIVPENKYKTKELKTFITVRKL